MNARLGPDDPSTVVSMKNLAGGYQDAGRLVEAECLLRCVVESQRKKDGRQSVGTAGALAVLGENLLIQEKYIEAEPLLRECLVIREEKLPDDFRRYNTLSLLGGALLGQERYDEAEPLLLQGYDGMKQREDTIPPVGKRSLINAVERIVRLCEATHRGEEASTWRKKLPAVKKPEG